MVSSVSSVVSKLRTALQAWWNGKSTPYKRENAGGGFVIIGSTNDRHWTAKVTRALVGFIQRDWKWAIGVALSLVGLWIAYLKL